MDALNFTGWKKVLVDLKQLVYITSTKPVLLSQLKLDQVLNSSLEKRWHMHFFIQCRYTVDYKNMDAKLCLSPTTHLKSAMQIYAG